MNRFDSYAHDYDMALNRGISVSGEDKTFFAKGRVVWLSHCLKRIGVTPRSVLDYGCGTGTATSFLVRILKVDSIVGVDVSAESLEVARREHSSSPAEYRLVSDYQPNAQIDLAYCNGVFHHVAPEQRVEAARYIRACLKPGGLFALWDNNPWNPGTRYIMSKIPFDRDAVPMSAREARTMMRQAGFADLRTAYCFIFPHCVRWFRPLESWLTRMPLGAQYQVLGRKPE
ncbi:MAG: methyltransferase domain-containing protein [Patescibacteria group bacterium]|nr:methyltransferase domain-containing protein [Patescibacteria group bacterium]